MTGDGSEIAATVCALPSVSRSRNLSMFDAVRAAGILSVDDLPSFEEVVAALRRNPLLIEVWLRYSEDKRTSGGFHLHAVSEGFVVGSIDPSRRVIFDDAAEACAEFILQELTCILGLRAPATAPPAPR